MRGKELCKGRPVRQPMDRRAFASQGKAQQTLILSSLQRVAAMMAAQDLEAAPHLADRQSAPS